MPNDGGVNNNCFNISGLWRIPSYPNASPLALGNSFSNADSQIGGERYGVPVGIRT